MSHPTTANLKAVYRKTTELRGCPLKALEEMTSAADAIGRAMRIPPRRVRAFVTDQWWNVITYRDPANRPVAT